MAGELIAKPVADLVAQIPNAAQPTPGQGLTLDLSGSLPLAVRQLLPGYLYSYKEYSAGNVTINTVAEASATTLVTADTIFFDGSTLVKIEFFCPGIAMGGTDATHGINLWDTTDLGRIYDGTVVASAGNQPVGTLTTYLTPTTGPHTFSIRVWQSAATNFVVMAGAGGAGVKKPMFIRVTRA